MIGFCAKEKLRTDFLAWRMKTSDSQEHSMRPLDLAQKMDYLMRIVVCTDERGNLIIATAMFTNSSLLYLGGISRKGIG